MGVDHTIQRRPLKPFKHFLAERFRSSGQRRALGNALSEGVEESRGITDATSVIIGSDLPVEERNSLSDGFVNYIEEMCEAGHSVMAIAVALE
jgi:hypothetical protein